MIREIVEVAKRIGLIVREPLISALPRSPLVAKSRGGVVADTLINETWKRTLTWVTVWSETPCVCVVPKEGMVLLVEKTRHGTDHRGHEVYRYALTIIVENRIFFQSVDICGEYTASSPRLPIMDLYDYITMKKFRPVPFGHVCGLQGFGMRSGDRCPACCGDTPLVREVHTAVVH
jgi:hypothetical protein